MYIVVSVPWVAQVFRDRRSLGSSPRLIAAFHARILMTPRHPPRALRSLTTPIGPPRPPSMPALKKEPAPPETKDNPSTGFAFHGGRTNSPCVFSTRRLIPNLPCCIP